MIQALFLFFAASAPAAEPAAPAIGPWRPGADTAVTTPPPAAAPPPATEAPAPAPTAADTPGRAPAVAPTDATAASARVGDEIEVARSRYKFGKGWTVSSKDGRFSLNLRGRIQFRYELQHPNAEGERTEHSMHVRRFRLQLQGNVFSPFVKYYFQFGFSPNDMSSELPDVEGSIRRNPLRDGRIGFDRLRDFNVWMGQMKVPFSRQRVNSSSALNMPDRSLVNAEFNLSRDLGLMASSQDLGGLGGRLAYYAGVFMGEGRNAFDMRDFGMLYVGRLEVRPFGAFDDYTEGDLERSKTPGLSIAGAYAYQDRARALRGVAGDYPADGGTTDFHHVSADILLKWRGLSLNTVFHLRRGLNRISGGALDDMGVPIPTAPARQGIGWFAQIGYVVPKIPFEVVGRYAITRNIYGAASSMPSADEAAGGLNYYIVGHDLKVQLDYSRLWDTSLGATAAEAARNGVDRVRLQVQLYF